MFSSTFMDAALDCICRNSDLPDEQIYFSDNGTMIALEKLSGDASHKTFYRFHFQGKPYLFLIIPPDIPASEEVFIPAYNQLTQGEIFAITAAWLAEQINQVVKVYAQDPGCHGFILTDAGDVTLYDEWQQHGDQNDAIQAIYFKAIDWLIQLQQLCDPPAVIADRHFNQAALLQECLEFNEYSPNPPAALHSLDFAELAKQIAAQPQVICHRDYQSKNIMLLGERELMIIDQQDMCIGPLFYDIASLLYDPYVQLSTSVIDACIEHYHQALQQSAVVALSLAEVRAGIQLNAIQRLLKAAGRYQRINQLKGNSGYLQYYDVAVARVQALL